MRRAGPLEPGVEERNRNWNLLKGMNLMDNEEQILILLQSVLTKVDRMEAGQVETNNRLEKLEAAQIRQEIKTDAIADELQKTKDILVLFENDYKRDRGALFDSLDLLKDKAARIEAKTDKNNTRLDNHELHIRALERPVW